MDKHTIFAKTHKGKEEIETRQYRLSAKLRMVLILVDGVSDTGKLAEKGGSPDLAAALEELSLLGFIQDKRAAPRPAAIITSAASVTGTPIKAELVRISRDILGAQADKVIKRIEKSADSKEALGATLRNCIELARLVIDEKKSTELGRKYSEALNRN
jgi:hypothetical protein